jgi:uncharacterized protein (TIGR00255 family)
MTGYGRAEYTENGLDILVEVKTVNNRNLDINSKIPRAFICFEDAIRNVIKDKLSRGRVDLYVSFSDKREKEVNFILDEGLAKGYYDASNKLSALLNIPNDYTVSRLMSAPDVLKDDGGFIDYSDLKDVILYLTNKALDNLNEMRQVEGDKLVADMCARMENIKVIVDGIKERAPFVAKEYKEKLTERIKTFLEDVKYDEARLLNEVAFFTDKSNIDEELTRLSSHISQFGEIIKVTGAGKKLDFLIQEFNREANTICSKSNDLQVTNLGLSLKNEIEKIREQVQNIE